MKKAGTEARWIDRLTLDGSWPGNLFAFYHRVINKLTADLKVPFRINGGQRQDDTLVHQALREALVNTLVHADYTGRASVLVVKRPDMFGFRNPGLMRVPQEISTEHTHDLTLAFQRLMKAKLLHSSGHGRGTIYYRLSHN